MHDGQLDLPNDLQRRTHEAIQSVAHDAFSGVLNRHYAEVSGTGFHLSKDQIDRGDRQHLTGVAKMFDGSSMREGAFRAEISNLEGLLQGQAGCHDLPKKTLHRL